MGEPCGGVIAGTGVVLRRFEARDADWVIDRHRMLYARDEGFDESFPALVADIVAAFLDSHDPARERGWIAERGLERLGCIFCVGLSADVGKLRLFLVLPEARGTGLGRRLLDRCMSFAREAGYARMQLWTHESHRAACALYARNGWVMTDSRPVRSFGVDLVEQSWEIGLQEACIRGRASLHRAAGPP